MKEQLLLLLCMIVKPRLNKRRNSAQKVLSTHLVEGWVDPRASLDTGEAKYLLLLLRIKPQFLSHPACSLATLPPKVPSLPELNRYYIQRKGV
jgi:hypothetical protein